MATTQSNRPLRRVLGFMLTGFMVMTLPLLSAAAELPLPPQPHIVVVGYGVTEQVPDLIRLRFDITETRPTLSAAKTVVDQRVAAAISAATQQGVSKDAINASKIDASPQYEWRNSEREYLGERVSRELEITLTKPERFNDLVDALLAAGITTLQSPQLDFSKRSELEQIALKQALDNARTQAQTIARHLGSDIGNIYQIAPVDRPMMMQRMEMVAADSRAKGGAPLQLGKQAIEQQVRVVYLLP